MLRGRLDIDVLDPDSGGGNWLTILTEAIDVEFDRLTDQFPDLRFGLSNRDAPRQVWDVRTETGFAPLDDDGVLHKRLPQASLFEDAVERAGRHIETGLPRDSDGAGFRGVLVLAMTPPDPSEVPAVRLEQR